MLSKSRIKFIRSLQLGKFRKAEGLFLAEGDKMLKEALNKETNNTFKIHSLFGTQEWYDKNKGILKEYENIFELIKDQELKQISSLKTPNKALAILHLNNPQQSIDKHGSQLVIALDNLQDPGNMGTIIRLADWFGINNILLSNGCVDPFSPKVVQATMGSIFRVNVIQVNLPEWIKTHNDTDPVYGAVLEGENIYRSELTKKGIIVFGNESQGIGKEIMSLVTHPLTIPRGNTGSPGPESLNVSVSLGIILSEFSRRGF